MPEVTPPQAQASFYRALEDRHRGSRELIKQRLRVYLPFIAAAAARHPERPVLDAGCGRGEWLELLKDIEQPARGVDTDLDMLAACSGLGLHVIHTDVLTHLQSCPDHSLLAVTGFHIAEHLPFDQLQILVAQAWRVLVPGGLLILETPNPENLLVGSASFYIDPTHQRPLPTQLLTFLAEHQGFHPVQLLRLQEEPRIAQNLPVNLYDVLANVSPDYSIVAHSPLARQTDPGPTSRHPSQPGSAPTPEVGVSLYVLANRYEQKLQQQLQSLQAQLTAQLQATQTSQHAIELALRQNQKLEDAQQQLSAAQQELSSAQQELSASQQQLSASQQQLVADSLRLSAAQQQLADQTAAVYASRSWRLTAPLRWAAQLLGRGAGRRKP